MYGVRNAQVWGVIGCFVQGVSGKVPEEDIIREVDQFSKVLMRSEHRSALKLQEYVKWVSYGWVLIKRWNNLQKIASFLIIAIKTSIMVIIRLKMVTHALLRMMVDCSWATEVMSRGIMVPKIRFRKILFNSPKTCAMNLWFMWSTNTTNARILQD